MSLSRVIYTKDWNKPSDFPTVETSETQVRADIQELYDQVRSCVNLIADEIESTLEGASGASQIGLSSVTGVSAINLQAAIEELKGILDTKASSSIVENDYELKVNALKHFNKVELDGKTGIFTFTTEGGEEVEIDTALESIPTTMKFYQETDPNTGKTIYKLGIYDKAGTLISSENVSSLFNEITVTSTATVALEQTVDDTGVKTITANVVAGSIGESQIDSAYMTAITTAESNAESAATRASNYADNAQIARSNASAFASKAHDYMERAGVYEESASDSASDARGYMSKASGYASQAANSVTNASGFAENASGYASAASTAQSAAETAETNAKDAQAIAEQKAAEAAASATAAATSAAEAESAKTFFATYGTTTFAEVKAAVSAGKAVVLTNAGTNSAYFATLTYIDSNAAIFTALDKSDYSVTSGTGGIGKAGAGFFYTYTLKKTNEWVKKVYSGNLRVYDNTRFTNIAQAYIDDFNVFYQSNGGVYQLVYIKWMYSKDTGNYYGTAIFYRDAFSTDGETVYKNGGEAVTFTGKADGTTEFVDKYHDSLDLGDFVDADLAEHMADVNAHSSIVIDAMATAATTQDTLDAHKSAEDSHGNLTVDGGDLRDPKKYRNQETLEEHETASYAHSNLVIEGGIV